MTDISKKSLARFEHTSEAMPQLSAEVPGPAAAQAAPENSRPEVRSIRVPKLDQQTVWRVIEMLRSL